MKEKVIICAVLLFAFPLIILPIYFFGVADNNSSRLYANRGTWHGHIYVNEFMGFQLEIPPTWFKYTEEELANVSSVGAAMIAEREDNFNNHAYLPFYARDMSIRDFFSGNSVVVATNPVSLAVEQNGEIENLQAAMIQLGELSNVFQHFQIGNFPRRLGENYWHYMTYEVFTNRIQMYLIHFYGGFRREITITADSLDEIEDILNIFTAIDPQLKGIEGIIPTMENSVPAISRGTWDGHTYTNPTLGFKFTAPSHYRIFSDDDNAIATGVPPSFFDGEFISNDLWVKVNQLAHSVACMGAQDDGSIDASIHLFAQRVPLGSRDFPLHKYLQVSLEHQRSFQEQNGFNTQVIEIPDTFIISGHEWHMGRVIMYTPSIRARIDVFMTIAENTIWIMFIGSSNDYELQEILSGFSTVM